MEKLILALVTVAMKLWLYFESFRVVYMMEYLYNPSYKHIF